MPVPQLRRRKIDYAHDAVTQAWYGKANVYHDRFEQAFADYLGVRFTVALPSCTSAIHLALAALGVGPGDEVIVPDATWIASAAPISYVGAAPIFADIDEKTWCLSADAFEACVTSRTKAVIPVNLYGNVADMDAIRAVAARHGIAVIEDAAESVGAEYKGRKAGALGDTGVFSFHGSKTLTTGEGGMLVTDREDIYRRALFLRDHGRTPGDNSFCNTEIAFKYKMSSMQAALGLAQLERIEELIERKREIFGWYLQGLKDFEKVTLNYEMPHARNSYWMVTVVFDPHCGMKKEELQQQLSDRQIDCRPFFHPLSSIPAYENFPEARRARARNHAAYKICPFGLNLPSALNLTRHKVKYVCESLLHILRR